MRRCGASVPALLALVLAGCSTGGAAAGEENASAMVFASASLTEAFTLLEEEFAERSPDSPVEINYGSASLLAEQIRNDAPADLFASADAYNMDKVLESGRARGEAAEFARNSMQIVVPPGNPARVSGLGDLLDPELSIALASPEVPIGRAAREGFAKAGLPVPEASQEADTKAVLTRVLLGEADAGIVWRTDVEAAGEDVAGVALSEEHNVRSRCMVVLLGSGSAPRAAEEFQEFVLSEEGREVLEGFGFESP